MIKNIKLYTLGTLVFLLLLSLSGNEGAMGAVAYPAAFILPTAALLLITKKDGFPTAVRKVNTALLLPTAAPALLLIFGISYLTAFVIFTMFGVENSVQITGDILFDVFTLAIAPAILEEMLFRYVPLKIIAPYSAKTALLVSALFFALVHSSFFAFPHAFVAGTVFIALDLAAGSVMPSVILHLLNNLFSVAWEYARPVGLAPMLVISLSILALMSLIIIIIWKKKYSEELRRLFSREDKARLPVYTLALVIPTVTAAILELMEK